MRLERELPVGEVAAERQLVVAAHEREIVADLRSVGREPARSRIVHLEPIARDDEDPRIGLIAVDVRADVVRVERRWSKAEYAGPVVREPQRVHRVGPEDTRVTDDQGVCQRVHAQDVPIAGGVIERQRAVPFTQRDRLVELGGHVPAEDRVVGGPLVVGAPQILVLGAVVQERVGHLAARVCRRWQILDHVDRSPAELRGVDAVVHEPATQVDLPAAVARRRRECREVAGQHLGGRHPRDIVGRLHLDHGGLIRAEEEELVGHNWPAERAAELVAPQPIIHEACRRALSGRTGFGR